MRKRRPRNRIARIRQVVQLVGLFVLGAWLFYGAFHCPYWIPFVSCTQCPTRVCPGTWMFAYVVGVIVISGLIAGRAFCGWACPMGAIQDLLDRVPKLRALRRPRPRSRFAKVDRWLKGIKYVLLALAVVAVLILHHHFAIPVRGHSLWSLDAIRVSWLTYDPYQKARVVILVAGVVLAFALTRAWCRYLCPLGALLSIFNRISLFRLAIDEARCIDCGKYPLQCRMYTTPGTAHCVVCGDCIEGCPRDAVGFRLRYGRRRAEPEEKKEEAASEAQA